MDAWANARVDYAWRDASAIKRVYRRSGTTAISTMSQGVGWSGSPIRTLAGPPRAHHVPTCPPRAHHVPTTCPPRANHLPTTCHTPRPTQMPTQMPTRVSLSYPPSVFLQVARESQLCVPVLHSSTSSQTTPLPAYPVTQAHWKPPVVVTT